MHILTIIMLYYYTRNILILHAYHTYVHVAPIPFLHLVKIVIIALNVLFYCIECLPYSLSIHSCNGFRFMV